MSRGFAKVARVIDTWVQENEPNAAFGGLSALGRYAPSCVYRFMFCL